MSRAGFRFRPPPVEISAAVRWMLVRAFGPAGAAAPGLSAAEGEEALALCRRCELSARVAARQGRARLEADLGVAAAEGFSHDRARVLAGTLRLLALAERVTAAAAALDLPLVFLKLAGLELAGLLAAGSRAACDLDVLVPAGRAVALQRALVAAGWRASRVPPPEHQLAALAAPEGIVEVHRVLLGVRVVGGRSATVEDLAAAGLLLPVARFPSDPGGAAGEAGGQAASDWAGRLEAADQLAGDPAGRLATSDRAGRLATLAPAAAVAHTVVHGMAQHGWSPLAYSLFKMIGDLVDLGFGGAAGPALLADVAPWVAGEVAAGELAAVQGLCAVLAAGGELGGWGESPAPAALLLRHALAGRLQPRYERALKLGLFRRQPSDHAEPARLARSLLATLWLSRARIDAIYGPPRHRLGYLGRRLARPFDLLARFARAGGRALALRRRRTAPGLYTPGR